MIYVHRYLGLKFQIYSREPFLWSIYGISRFYGALDKFTNNVSVCVLCVV